MPAPSITWPTTYVMGQAITGRLEAPITPVATVLVPSIAGVYGTNGEGSTMNWPSPVVGTYGGRVEFTATRDLTTYRSFGAQFQQTGFPFNTASGGQAPAGLIDTLANGGMSLVWFDSSGNWSEFYFYGNEFVSGQIEDGGWAQFRGPGGAGALALTVDRGRTPDNTSGVLDWSQIDGFEFIMRSIVVYGGTPAINVGSVVVFDPVELTAGEVANPASFSSYTNYFKTGNANYNYYECFRDTGGIFNGGVGEIYEPRFTYLVGDGVTPTYFRDDGSLLAEYPLGENANATQGCLFIEGINRGFIINTSATCDHLYNGTVFAATDVPLGESFTEVIGNSAADVLFTNCQFYRKSYVNLKHSVSNGTVFDNVEELEIDTTSEVVNCTYRNSSITSKGLYVQSVAGDYSNITLFYPDTVLGDHITINPPATGTWVFTGISVGGVTTLNIHNESAVTTITVEIPAGISFSTSTAGGTVNVIQPTSTFTINSNESGSLIQIFTSGTQTVLGSTIGTTLAFSHSSQTVDYVVQKAGFLPQRFTGEVLSGNLTVNVNLVADPVYDGTHSLIYGVDLTYDRVLKLLTLSNVAEGVDVYSALIDAYINESSLLNTDFDVQANGPTSFIFKEDMEFDATSSINNFKRAGIEYLAIGGATAAQWSSVYTLSSVPAGAQARYQQTAGSGTTDAINIDEIDQAIQIFGDITHGNFTLNTHLVVKYQENTYKQVRVDVVSLYNLTTLSPVAYPIATPFVSIDVPAGDPAISITITDHTAAPINVGGILFDYEVVDNGTNSGEDILREINYNLSLAPNYQGKLPFNYPDIVTELGDGFDTTYDYVEDEGAGLHGFYVSRTAQDHPDFLRFQGNSGAYYVPAVVNVAQTSGMLAGSNIYVYNITTDVDVVNGVQVGEWSLLYTEGTTFTEGDEVRVRICYENGSNYKLPIETFVIAGATGFTIPVAQEEWTPVNALGIDGSLITEFALDDLTGNLQIDINDPNGETEKKRVVAFSAFSLGESALAIKYFFGGLLVEDVANYRVIVSKADIKFDNIGLDVIFTDTDTRMYRDDGTSLIAAGSNTIQLESGKVYVAAGGGGGGDATAANQQQILAELGEIQGAGFVTADNSLVSITDDIASIPGGGGGGDATEAKQDLILADLAEIQGVGFNTNDDSLTELRTAIDGIDTGGDATAANQVLILEDIAEVKGIGFNTATDALVNISTDVNAIDAGDATEAKQDTILVGLSDIQGVGFDTANNSLTNISDDVNSIDAGDATLSNQTTILSNQSALDAKLDTKSSQTSVDNVQATVDIIPTVADIINGMTVDGETFDEWVLILRDFVNTIDDDGNGNAIVRGKDDTTARLTYTYDEATGSRLLTGINYS